MAENLTPELHSCLRDTADGGFMGTDTGAKSAKSMVLKESGKNFKPRSGNVFSSVSGETGHKKKSFVRKILSKKLSKEENSIAIEKKIKEFGSRKKSKPFTKNFTSETTFKEKQTQSTI